MASKDLELQSEVSKLPLHLEVLQELVQPRRIVDRQPIPATLAQPRTFQFVEHEPDGRLANTDLPREVSDLKLYLNSLLHGAAARLADLQDLMDHPAGGIGEQQVLDLRIGLRQPLGEL